MYIYIYIPNKHNTLIYYRIIFKKKIEKDRIYRTAGLKRDKGGIYLVFFVLCA